MKTRKATFTPREGSPSLGNAGMPGGPLFCGQMYTDQEEKQEKDEK